MRSQSRTIDSLHKLLINSKEDISKVKILNQLGKDYFAAVDYKKAIGYYNDAKKLSASLNDTIYQLTSVTNLGDAYTAQGAYSAALHCYFDALDLMPESKKNSPELARLLSFISISYWRETELLKALEFQKKALAIYLKLGDRKGLAKSYNNLGIIYRSLGNYGYTLDYYFKAVEISKDMADIKTLMNTYNNIGYIYYVLNKYETASKYFSTSLKMAEEENDLAQVGIVLGNMGAISFRTNDYKTAEAYLLRALKISQDLNDEAGLQDINFDLYRVYQKTNKIEKAFLCYQEYIKARDILKNEEIEKETQIGEIKHEFEKEKLELKKDQEKRDAISKSEKKRQQQVIYAVSVCLIIVIFLSIFLYNRFKIAKAQKITIEHQKHLVDEKQKEILDSINYAKRIQESLFDNFDSVHKFFSDAFILNKPKDIVSGDFYWLNKKIMSKQISETESIVNELFFIAVCDSTGHGVPGGFMSLLNTAYLSEAVNEKNIYEPNKIFDYVRKRLINTMSKNNQKDGFDGVLMCFHKSFSFKNKTLVNTEIKLSYAAAYNAPVLVTNNNLNDLAANKMPVGYGERKEDFTLFKYDLAKDDIIYIFTDGYADQFGGPKGKKFMHKKQNSLFLSISNLPMNEQATALNSNFTEWKGNLGQVDDVLVIGIKI